MQQLETLIELGRSHFEAKLDSYSQYALRRALRLAVRMSDPSTCSAIQLSITIIKIADMTHLAQIYQRPPSSRLSPLSPNHTLQPKTPIALPQGSPPIGTYRLRSANFEKLCEASQERGFIASMVIDQACQYLSVTELRVEDYYILRTAHPDDPLLKNVTNRSQLPFNPALHVNNLKKHLVQPNLNRAWPLNSSMANSNNAANYYHPNSPYHNYNSSHSSHSPPRSNAFNSHSNQVNAQHTGLNPANPLTTSNAPSLTPSNAPSLSQSQNCKVQSPLERLALLNKPSEQSAHSNSQNAFNRPFPNPFQQNQSSNLPPAVNGSVQFRSNSQPQVQFNNSCSPATFSSQPQGQFNNSCSPPTFSSQPNPVPPPNNPLAVLEQNANNANNLSPQKRPPPQELTAFDEFLHFVNGDLINLYNQNQDLRPHVEAQVKRYLNFHLRTSHSNHVGTGRGEQWQQVGEQWQQVGEQWQQVKKLMGGVQNQFEGRNSLGSTTPEMLRYLQSVWQALQDIEKVYQGGEYLRSHNNDFQQAAQQLIEKSEEKQLALMYRMGELGKAFQQEASLPVEFAVGRHDPAAREQQNLAAKWMMLRQQCLRLKELEEKERMEREDHLYDCFRSSQQEPPEIDDYISYRRRKKDNPEVIVVVRQHKDNTPKHSQYRSAKTQQSYSTPNRKYGTVQKSPYISEFHTGTPESHSSSTVTFRLSIVWVDEHLPDELYKCFEGSFQLAQPVVKAEVQEYFIKAVRHALPKAVRSNAQFKFSDIRRKNSVLDMAVKIRQRKLNPPQGYACEPAFPTKDNAGLELTALRIANAHGRIEWEGGIDIAELDLANGQVEIGESVVQCSSQCLNLPCTITFFSLPAKVQQMESRCTQQQIQQKLSKYVSSCADMELMGIDWAKRHYSIAANCFFQPDTGNESEKKTQLDDGHHFSLREVTPNK